MEIVNPETGRPLPDGESGEIVVTTLTRIGMPLIRYRTGDISRFHVLPCACGTVLKRLDRITGRLCEGDRMFSEGSLTLPILDEALFSLPGIMDFIARLCAGPDGDSLSLVLSLSPDADPDRVTALAREKLIAIPALRTGELLLDVQLSQFGTGSIMMSGNPKRILRE